MDSPVVVCFTNRRRTWGQRRGNLCSGHIPHMHRQGAHDGSAGGVRLPRMSECGICDKGGGEDFAPCDLDGELRNQGVRTGCLTAPARGAGLYAPQSPAAR